MILPLHRVSEKTIHFKVCVSENTVKGYVSSIMRKLDCDNRVKLVLKALELKLV